MKAGLALLSAHTNAAAQEFTLDALRRPFC
jgi:hypothetical protein